METTETAGSIAAACDDKLLLEKMLDSATRSAQSLAPAIRSLLSEVGWRPTDVELVAVAVGPGSFTGLRVGVTTAKTFAYSVGAQVFGVETLEVIASAVPAAVERLSTAVDAQRGQVAAQEFRREAAGDLLPTGPWQLLDVQTWLDQLAPETYVASPMLRKLTGRMPGHVCPLPPEYWSPSASAIARLAVRRYQAGQRQEIWSLAPCYSRRSAAEEKLEAKRCASEDSGGQRSDGCQADASLDSPGSASAP